MQYSKHPSLCLISFLSYPLFNPVYLIPHGGAEVELFFLAKKMGEAGYPTHMVVGDFGQKENEKHDSVTLWKSLKLQNSGVLKGIKNTIVLIKILKKINADIYLMKGAGFLTFQVALFCFLFHKIFIFKTSHRKNMDGSLKEKSYHPFYKWALHYAHQVVVQNQEDIEIIKKNYKVKALCIRNFQPIPSKKELTNKIQRKTILWVGRLEPIKQPELFIEMAKTFPKESFVMIGSGPNQVLKDKILKMVQSAKNIKLKINVPHNKIEKFYKNAKLFVNTSQGEGFPNTFIEALKWGVPLASFIVNPDHCLDQSQLGVWGNGNWEQWIAQIKKNLSDSEKWEQYSENAYLYAKNNFGESVLNQWEDLWDNLKRI